MTGKRTVTVLGATNATQASLITSQAYVAMAGGRPRILQAAEVVVVLLALVMDAEVEIALVVEGAEGVVEGAAGVVDGARGVVEGAAGVVDGARGVVDGALGVVEGAAGVVESCRL